jgi:enoyl-CoA hydratase/3-hydroxyacyl-CoA dehydrogenase
MKIEEITKVCYVGAGTMGCANSLVAAVAGYDVVLFDVEQQTLDQVAGRHQEMASYIVENGLCTAEDIGAALARVSLSADLATAAEGVDLVSESVFESLALKRKLHRQFDQVFPSGTIITTNSSALMVSEIEDVVARGELFAALHSHLGSTLYDIVPGPRTSATTVDILKRYVVSLGGFALVLKKENPGYVLNATLGPMLTMAMMLAIEGVATPEQLDRAWMNSRRTPIGPFGLLDLFGLDVSLDNWDHPKPTPNVEQVKAKIMPFLSAYVQRGELGQKTGQGFYRYPDPGFQQPDFLAQGDDDTFIRDALNSSMIVAAVLVAQGEVADPEDIDRAWMVATSLDIGPFGLLDELGIDSFLTTLETQVALGLFHPDSAGLASSYLKPYSDRGDVGEKSRVGFYVYPDPLYKTAGFTMGHG